jgi:hypothetical protein
MPENSPCSLGSKTNNQFIFTHSNQSSFHF